jgi:hypothetical protein
MITIFFALNDNVESKLIRFITNSDYSHCGFVDKTMNTIIDSTIDRGVSEYPISTLILNYDKIFFVDLNCVSYKAINYARLQLGKKFDWTAIIGINMFHRTWYNEDKWFCSELVTWACNRAYGKFVTKNNVLRVTPNDVLNISKALGGKLSTIK